LLRFYLCENVFFTEEIRISRFEIYYLDTWELYWVENKVKTVIVLIYWKMWSCSRK